MKLFSASLDPDYPDRRQILLLVVFYFAISTLFLFATTIPVLFGKLIGWEFSLFTYFDLLRPIASPIIYIPLIIYVSRKSGISYKWELKSPGIRFILLLVLLAIAIRIIIQPFINPVDYITTLIGGSVRLFNFNLPEFNFYWVLNFIFLVLIVPIVEEIFWRKQIFGLLLKNYSPTVAIVLGSALFACAHWQLNNIGALFIWGLLFSFVYYKTKSLEASILLHSITNLTSSSKQGYEYIDVTGMYFFKFIIGMVICAIIIYLIISYIDGFDRVKADYQEDKIIAP